MAALDAKLWIANGATDAARIAKQAQVGDLVYDGTTLSIAMSTGLFTISIAGSAASAPAPPAATTAQAGVVKRAAAVTNLTDNTGVGTVSDVIGTVTLLGDQNAVNHLLVAKINALQSALRTAGILT